MSSADEDTSDEEFALRQYSVVHFIKRGRKGKTRLVDMIPTNWLNSKKQPGRFSTKFPESSDNPEDKQLLDELVKSLADPPAIWKSYTVAVLGQASMFIILHTLYSLFYH